LRALPGVVDVHDLHVWAMSTSDNALTAHLVINEDRLDRDALLEQATVMLHERFEIRHSVLQQESREYAAGCPMGERC
ncbi:MAG TPA: cation transporter, partial [Halomonas sp.]|nr:cation transporter [Halomonas sp.]